MLGMPRQEFLDLAGERHIALTVYGPGDFLFCFVLGSL
jgi:hypothetical protein